MLISKLVCERTKETPADITIRSHGYLVRAGYIKSVNTGVYTLSMPAKKIVEKIQGIIREEMNAVEGQEVLFPVTMPAELWQESGRYSSIGEEMARFKDRNQRDMVLGMTHEEAAVHLARNWISSYNQLPCMIYQIQTKFRDEARPRAGLIRVREFTMKDAYSFHETKKDLLKYYDRVFKAYERIFARVGMKKVIAVKSDTGMMGGSEAHEFMLLTPIGEDTLAICPHCGYKANMEVADGGLDNTDYVSSGALAEVFTGKAKEIADVCKFLGVDASRTVKAVSFAVKGDANKGVLVFLRGDLEVNEAKLKRIVKVNIVPSDLKDSNELAAGNIGPIGLNLKSTVIVYDRSLKGAKGMVIGANKSDYHIKNFDVDRDLKAKDFYDVAKVKDGVACVACGKSLKLENGIEVGNIFQLGTKYTEAMGMSVSGRDGKAFTPIMGCYGIGVGRALASVAEELSDDKGLVFPIQIAPWHIYLAALRPDEAAVKKAADKMYKDLNKAGLETLYDDRAVSPGVKFADSELMGIPYRVVLSPRALESGQAEVVNRITGEKEFIAVKDVVKTMKKRINDEIKASVKIK